MKTSQEEEFVMNFSCRFCLRLSRRRSLCNASLFVEMQSWMNSGHVQRFHYSCIHRDVLISWFYWKKASKLMRICDCADEKKKCIKFLTLNLSLLHFWSDNCDRLVCEQMFRSWARELVRLDPELFHFFVVSSSWINSSSFSLRERHKKILKSLINC